MFWRKHEQPTTFTFDAGKTKAPNLKEGKARIVVETVSNDLRGRKDTTAQDVNVVLTAPRVIPDDLQHYINQGGMELVTFNATGSYNEAGVRVGKYTFRSFPAAGQAGAAVLDVRVLVGAGAGREARRVCANLAGTEATATFWFKLFPKSSGRAIEIDEKLLEKLVTSVDPTGQLAPGTDVVAASTRSTRDAGQEQSAARRPPLQDGREDSLERTVHSLGQGRGRISPTSATGCTRGTSSSRAAHLGFDLSDVQNGPVNAANDGRVVWADNLGIYGNCVVLDHGYALQSIYGHMRQIDVKVGDMVKKGQSMGSRDRPGSPAGSTCTSRCRSTGCR